MKKKKKQQLFKIKEKRNENPGFDGSPRKIWSKNDIVMDLKRILKKRNKKKLR